MTGPLTAPTRPRPLWWRFLAALAVALWLAPMGAAAQQSTETSAEATKQLFAAVGRNDLPAVQASVGAGADIGAQNSRGLTPVDLAVDRGYFEVAHFLLSVRNFRASQAEQAEQARRTQAAVEAPRPVAATPPPPPQPTPPPAAAALPQPPAWPADRPNPFDPNTVAPGSTLPVMDTTAGGGPAAEVTPVAPQPAVAPQVAAAPAAPVAPKEAPAPVQAAPVPETPSPPASPAVAEAAEPESKGFFDRVADFFGVGEEAPVPAAAGAGAAASAGPSPAGAAPAVAVVTPPPPAAAPVAAQPLAATAEAPVAIQPLAETVEAPAVAAAPAAQTPAAPEPRVAAVAAAPAAPIQQAAPAAAPGSQVTIRRGPPDPPPGRAEEEGLFGWLFSHLAFWRDEEESAEAAPEPEADETAESSPTGEPSTTPAAETQVAVVAPPPPAAPPPPRVLEGVSLALGQSVTLDRMRPPAPPGTPRWGRKPCVEKRRGAVAFCVVDVDWPADVAHYFNVSTVMYQGTRALVRYDANLATRFHALFGSEAVDAVVAHFERLLGPPTDRWQRRIAPLAAPRRDNPTVAWRSRNPVTGEITVLEVRKYDDTRGGFPDTRRGAVMLYRMGTDTIFPELSMIEVMLLPTSKRRN